jgi:glycosyltransferase involved in cell wall biosynthesis
MGESKSTPLVSVITPTCNSENTVQQCLESIRRQAYDKIEVLVVDHQSTDKTVQIARQLKTKVLFVSRERSVAKNLGARRAEGDFLLFVDSDMVLDPMTVKECVTICTQKNLDAVVIPLSDIANGFLATCRKLDRASYYVDPKSSSMPMPRFFRKSAFLAVNGFDENLVCGEDFDLARRIEKSGYRIGVASASIGHLEEQLSMKRIVLKSYYYGKSFMRFFSKSPRVVLQGYCPTRFAWNIRGLFGQPFYLAGIAVIKLFEYIAFFAGVLSSTLIGSASSEKPNFY